MALLVGEKEKERENEERNTDTEEKGMGREVEEKGGMRERNWKSFSFFFKFIHF